MSQSSSFDPFSDVSELVGTSAHQLRLIFCLLVSVPLAILFPFLPSSRSPTFLAANAAHLYSIATTTWMLVGVQHLPRGMLQLLGMILLTYSITLWGAHQQKTYKLKGKKPPFKWPWLVFWVAMGQLFTNHIYRYVYSISLLTLEITGAMMVLVLKLIFFAWNVYDGQRPETELDGAQKAHALQEVPSLLSFLGYCTFFPSVNIGPAFTFRSYEAFTSHTVYKGSPRPDESEHPGIPPGRKRAAGERAAVGLFFLGIYAALAGGFGYERVLEDRFLERSMLSRIALLQVLGFFARTKYYAGWCIAEAGCIIAGLGYNATKGTWDAAINVRIRNIEFAQNWKILLDNWNINTNIFLRECVYKRLARPGRKPGFKSTQATWHGVNVAYYLTFFLGGFLQALCRYIRSTVRPFFLPPSGQTASPLKLFYDVLSVIALQTTLNYTVAPFMLLDLRPTLVAWQRLGYYGHWMAFLPLVFFWSGGGTMLRRGPVKQQLGEKGAKDYVEGIKGETAGARGAGQLGHAEVGHQELKRE